MSKSAKHPCHCCMGSGSETDHVKLGGELSGLRQKAGIGLRDMSRRLKVSHSFLCQLENGNRTWTPKLINRFLELVENEAIAT